MLVRVWRWAAAINRFLKSRPYRPGAFSLMRKRALLAGFEETLVAKIAPASKSALTSRKSVCVLGAPRSLRSISQKMHKRGNCALQLNYYVRGEKTGIFKKIWQFRKFEPFAALGKIRNSPKADSLRIIFSRDGSFCRDRLLQRPTKHPKYEPTRLVYQPIIRQKVPF